MDKQRRRRFRALDIGVVVAGLVVAVVGLAPNAQAVNDPGPKGNNGTVKIDGTDLNDGPGHSQKPNDPEDEGTDNDPHVTCGFQLEFFNFDTNQTADILFTAHAPTGSNGVLYFQNHLISDDGTGGAGNDLDEVINFDVENDFDTTQFTSVHPEHGWHVKLNITVYDAEGDEVPGAKKHKVFWVEGCQPDPCEEAVPGAAAVAQAEGDECNPCVDETDDAVNDCCVDETDDAVNDCCVDDPQQAGDDCCVNNPNSLQDECNPCPTESPREVIVAAAEAVVDPCNPGCVQSCVPDLGCVVDCTPDACPTLTGDQEAGADCTTDDCPNLPGDQERGAECTEDACPNMEGDQAPGTDCEPAVAPAEETPVAEPVPDEVLGEVIVAALPATGANTLPMVQLAAGLVLIGSVLVRQSRRITAKAR